jgi:hypothetical protein
MSLPAQVSVTVEKRSGSYAVRISVQEAGAGKDDELSMVWCAQ